MKMKRLKVHRHYFFLFFCQMSSLTKALLGICVFLFEIRESQELSGLSWSVYTTLVATAAATTTSTTVVSPEVLEVDGIPQFHSPQLKLTVKEGDRVLLPCKIHNLGDSHVTWRHGTNVLAGSNVSRYEDERIQLLPDLTLEIKKIARADEGEYECQLTGTFPRPGLIHSVTVHDAPSVSLLTKTNIAVLEGEDVEIGCIPHGNPVPRITWSMRDALLSIPKSMINLQRITLEKVTRKHAGLYICQADNGVGRPAIGAVYVRVLYQPEIETPKRRVHGGVGYKAQFICIVHADPPAEVRWRIKEKPVELSDRIRTEIVGLNEHSLVIFPVKKDDFNTYTCEANNSRGFDMRHIDFTGVPNPPIIRSWETQILVKGTVGIGKEEGTQIHEEIHVTLYWAVECYSPLIDYRLHFRPDKRNEINSFNEDRTPPWSELTIPADPSSTAFLHAKTFTLRGLQPSTIYEAAIKARNKYGWSPLSDICYFSTFPNSSSTRQKEFEDSLQKRKDLRPSDAKVILTVTDKEEVAEFISSQKTDASCARNVVVSDRFWALVLLSLVCLIPNSLVI